jgi:hypothetical protein
VEKLQLRTILADATAATDEVQCQEGKVQGKKE